MKRGDGEVFEIEIAQQHAASLMAIASSICMIQATSLCQLANGSNHTT